MWPGCGEAFGLTYLEAQAAGLPIVAQNTAGVPEVVAHEKTGLLTPEGDVQAYADAIRHVLTDHDLRAKMGSAARETVLAEHGLEKMASRLGEILDQSVWASQAHKTGGSYE